MSVENEHGLDQDALDTLTPEERAAITDPDMSPEEIAAMQAVAGDDELDNEDDDDLPAESATPANNDAPATNTDTPAVVEPVVATEPQAKAPNSEFVPRFTAELPADFAAQMDGIKSDARALAQKYKDGDIDFDEYTAELDQINERRDALNTQRVKAEIAQDMTEQTEEQRWQHTVDRFVDQVSAQIDYRKDTDKGADLDHFVKALAANPANTSQSMDWFLAEAHKRVKALHGITDPEPEPTKRDDKPAPAATRKPPVADLPKTLAQVPGGDGPGDVAGEFAHLDNLEGLELEGAIAAMNPAQRERYMRGE